MTYDPDDPRLTAYALGELDDVDRAAVEAQLAECPASRRAVADVCAAARLLTQQFAREPAPGLTAAQRLAIEHRLGPPAPSRPIAPTSPRRPRPLLLPLAVAASILVVLAGLFLPATQSAGERARQVAARQRVGPLAAAPRPAVPIEGGTIRDAVADSDETRSRYQPVPEPAEAAAVAVRSEPAEAPASPPPPVDAASIALASDAPAPPVMRSSPVGSKSSYAKADAQAQAAQPAPAPSTQLALRESVGKDPGDVAGGAPGGMMAGQGLGRAPVVSGGHVAVRRSASEGRSAPQAGGPAQLPVTAVDRANLESPGQAGALGGGQAMSTGGYPDGTADRERRFALNRLDPSGSADLSKAKDAPAAGRSAAAEPRATLFPASPSADASQLPSGKYEQPGVSYARPAQGQAKALSDPSSQGSAGQVTPFDINTAQSVKPRSQAASEPGNGSNPKPGYQFGFNVTTPDGPRPRENLGLVDANHQLQERERLAEPAPLPGPGNEAFAKIDENPFLRASEKPLSTFSIDVDTASYAIVRRFLNQGALPPRDAVRIEEMVNYFRYNDPAPTGDDPFSVRVELGGCPWNADHRLARIGLKGREVDLAHKAPANLVFLIDVSGSMTDANKLPLLKAGLPLLVEKLGENDRLTIVTYANGTRVALPPTPCDRKREILSTIEQLQAGGSTNGAAGIRLAYDAAIAQFIKGGINRVILCTDGDFNVGVTNDDELAAMAEANAKTGVFLSVLGFGQGNLKDAKMEKIADKGNGNYAYIDSLAEARKVLVEEMGGTLIAIAKDVKVQVDFNPARVAAYRLVGYENRLMADKDFHDDAKDAGEIGAGHGVTALYELIPPDKTRYEAARNAGPADAAKASDESFTVKLRFKAPDGARSTLIEKPVVDAGLDFSRSSDDLKFSASVAAFGLLLRDSKSRGTLTYDSVLEIAQSGVGPDTLGYRREFLDLVRRARGLAPR